LKIKKIVTRPLLFVRYFLFPFIILYYIVKINKAIERA